MPRCVVDWEKGLLGERSKLQVWAGSIGTANGWRYMYGLAYMYMYCSVVTMWCSWCFGMHTVCKQNNYSWTNLCMMFAYTLMPTYCREYYQTETTSLQLSLILVTLSLIPTECILPQWMIPLVVMSTYALLIAIVSISITFFDGFFVCYSYGIKSYIKKKKGESDEPLVSHT